MLSQIYVLTVVRQGTYASVTWVIFAFYLVPSMSWRTSPLSVAWSTEQLSHDTLFCPQCGEELPSSFKYCGHCGRRADAFSLQREGKAGPQTDSLSLARDERREITVLFADVTGFTSMCERLDPEDVHSVMNDCFAGLGRAIQQQEGLVDRYLGDAVLALFGAPLTHEDDPTRACFAALSMQAFLAEFSQQCKERIGMGLQMRVGIHCGMVVVGAVGSDARLVYGARGDTMNTAARIQSTAQPGTILVSREVAKRTRSLFEFGTVQDLALKGKEHPVAVCELLREKIRDGLNDPCDWTAIPMVGRDREVQQLVDYLRSDPPFAHWIEIVGEQGIGKTRLLHEAARMADRKVLVVASDVNTRARPFGLLRLILSAVLKELISHRGQVESREQFSAALGSLGEDLLPYVDALWHLVASGRNPIPVPDPDPQALRRTLERGIQTLFRCLVSHHPAVALFLDSFEHADTATSDLLEVLGNQSDKGWPISIIVASRATAYSQAQRENVLRLGPLSYESSSALLNVLLHDAELPQSIRQEILERAAGLPVLLVEMVRALVDEGLLTLHADGGVWTSSTTVKTVSLPASIRAYIAARLDRLPQTERELLCQSSVIGVEFSEALSEFLWHKQFPHGPAAAGMLQRLTQRGILREVTDRRYRFSQPSMREVCYETLLFRDRKALHAAIAQGLYQAVEEAETLSPELLAYHYEEGEQWAQAAAANLEAGDRACALYLNEEALKRYERVFYAMDRLPSPSQFDLEVRIKAYAKSAQILTLMGQYELAEQRALEMRRHAARGRDRAGANRLLAQVYVHTGRTEEAGHLLSEGLLAARSDWSAGEVVANVLYDQAELLRRAGQVEQAQECLRRCRLAVLSTPQCASMLLRISLLEGKIANARGQFAQAAECYAHAYEAAERTGSLSERASAANGMGSVARDLGDYSAALQHFERALEIWSQIGDSECIAGAHNNLGNVAMSQGDIEQAHGHHEASLRLSQQTGNIQGCGLAYINLALLALEEGSGQKALGLAMKAVQILGESGNRFLDALASVVLGEAYLLCEDLLCAKSTFEQIFARYDEAQHPLAIAGSWRGLGRIALRQGLTNQALHWLQRAHDLYERLKRVQEAARTGVYLAQAHWQIHEYEQARSRLEQAHERFLQIHARQDATMAERILREFEN